VLLQPVYSFAVSEDDRRQSTPFPDRLVSTGSTADWLFHTLKPV